MTEVLPVVLSLVGVVALMCGAMYLLKRLSGRFIGGSGASGLKVVTSVAVGQDKSIAAVRAGSKCLLVGVTAGGISLLCELTEADMELIAGSSDMAGKSFSECLKFNMKKAGADFFTPISEGKDTAGGSKGDS